MGKMAKLLPYACSKAVQRLLRFALLDVSLTTEGHHVYYLVSPHLAKLYVGAVGFKRPRSPYARLREHLSMVRCWTSRTSAIRYGQRAPALYKAIGKIGVFNVIQVVLASVTLHQLASELPLSERSFASFPRLQHTERFRCCCASSCGATSSWVVCMRRRADCCRPDIAP